MTASEFAAAIPLGSEPRGRTAVGTESLAEGLLLVRASAINVVRLQLAMERRDRRVALETVDELMLLDRRISDFVGNLSAPSGPLSAEARRLERQHEALAVERLVLAAGARGPRIASATGSWIEEPRSAAGDASAPLGDEALRSVPDRPAEPRRISVHLLVAVLMLAAFLAGGAAFLLFTEAGQALVADSALHLGAS